MYQYEELSDLVHARADRRSHLVSRIRGWLRRDRSPRLTIGLLLVPTAVWGVAVDYALRRGGLDLPPLRWVMAIFAAWPIFVLLLRWRAAAEWRSVHLDRLDGTYVRHDEAVEAILCLPKSEKQLKMEETFWRSVNQNSGRAGAAGLPSALLLGAATLGCWTIWKLIGSGPTLLADIIIDSEAIPRTPSLATRISSERWFSGALGGTGLFFLSLAVAAFLFAIALHYFSIVWANAHGVHSGM